MLKKINKSVRIVSYLAMFAKWLIVSNRFSEQKYLSRYCESLMHKWCGVSVVKNKTVCEFQQTAAIFLHTQTLWMNLKNKHTAKKPQHKQMRKPNQPVRKIGLGHPRLVFQIFYRTFNMHKTEDIKEDSVETTASFGW